MLDLSLVSNNSEFWESGVHMQCRSGDEIKASLFFVSKMDVWWCFLKPFSFIV